MNGKAKPALASIGVWGGVIAALGPIAMLIVDAMGKSADPKIIALSGVLGGLIAIYGRVMATAPISGIVKS